jgi:transposase
MQTPDEVAAMLRLKALGWGIKRIARELGCSHMTVRHYVAQGGWLPYRGRGRSRALAGLEHWVAERFRRHAGNADVVRQELLTEKGIKLSLRTIEREVAPLRRQLEAEARATIRFETPPGKQLQIDFGERRVSIGGDSGGEPNLAERQLFVHFPDDCARHATVARRAASGRWDSRPLASQIDPGPLPLRRPPKLRVRRPQGASGFSFTPIGTRSSRAYSYLMKKLRG